MKKKILTIVLTMAMLLTSAAAFAQPQDVSDVNTEIETTVVDVENTPAFIKAEYKIDAISDFDGFKVMFEVSDENQGIVNLTISENTVLVDNQGNEISAEDIKIGDTVTMFCNANTPALMVLPPRYTPDVLVLNTDKEGFAEVDYFSDELVNSKNTLALNIDDSTVISFANGAKMIAKADDVKNSNAAVFYNSTTRSIPAQTTPSKIIILSETVLEDAPIDVPAAVGSSDTILDDAMGVDAENYAVLTVNGNKVDAHFVENEGVTMLPIRAVAEAMGLEVNWDSDRKAVSVGTMQMGVFLQIGENKYSKARMRAAELETAPTLIEIDETSLTYVPVSFFSEILEADVSTDEVTGSVAITYSAE